MKGEDVQDKKTACQCISSPGVSESNSICTMQICETQLLMISEICILAAKCCGRSDAIQANVMATYSLRLYDVCRGQNTYMKFVLLPFSSILNSIAVIVIQP